MPKDNYGIKFPKGLSATKFHKDYVELTIGNKELLVVGRVIWVIRAAAVSGYTICGCFTVRPRFQKGKVLACKGDPMNKGNLYQVKMFIGETEEEYMSEYNSLLEYGMSKRELFVIPDDPLVQYKWS